MPIRPKKHKIEQTDSGFNVVMDLTERDYLILLFTKTSAGLRRDRPDLTTELQQIEEARLLFDKYVTSVAFTPIKGNTKHYNYSFTIEEGEEDGQSIKESIKRIIDAPIVKQVIHTVLEAKKKGGLFTTIEPPRPHKQSRSNLRTLAKLVGRDTSQPSLFSLPLEELQAALEQQTKKEAGIPHKEKISKNVGVLSLQLLKEYQHNERDDEGYISISDLGRIAAELKTDTKELKYYLLYLGGYQYPCITYYEESKEIGLQLAKLFDIEFRYGKKYESAEKKISADIAINTIQLLIDTPIKRIRVKPSPQFIRDLEGKQGRALGYTNVNDNFIALCRGLSDYAFKLLNYMTANRPVYKIAEDKLFKNLGLESQVKQQRPARIRARLADAFKELKEEGHLQEYTLPGEGEDLYSWTYTDKYVKHKDSEKKDPAAREYVDFEDQSIPVNKRRAAYKDWLMQTKNIAPAEAEKRAKGKYKDQPGA